MAGPIQIRFLSTVIREWVAQKYQRLKNRFPTPTPNQKAAIVAAARELHTLRQTWLHPPEWPFDKVVEFPGTVGGPWERYIDPITVTTRGNFKVGTVKYPRLAPRDANCAAKLAKRTLTALYNQRPAWLDFAHGELDAAVSAAYGWTPDMTDVDTLKALLLLNSEMQNAAPVNP